MVLDLVTIECDRCKTQLTGGQFINLQIENRHYQRIARIT